IHSPYFGSNRKCRFITNPSSTDAPVASTEERTRTARIPPFTSHPFLLMYLSPSIGSATSHSLTTKPQQYPESHLRRRRRAQVSMFKRKTILSKHLRSHLLQPRREDVTFPQRLPHQIFIRGIFPERLAVAKLCHRNI